MNESDEYDAEMLLAANDPMQEHSFPCRLRTNNGQDHTYCGCWCHNG